MNAYIIFQERDPKYANHVQAKNNNNQPAQLGQPGTQTQEHAPHCRRQDIEEDKNETEPQNKGHAVRKCNPAILAIRFPTDRPSA